MEVKMTRSLTLAVLLAATTAAYAAPSTQNDI
jgi:hypothetical protein